MPYPRQRSYGGGGGLNLGALFQGLYDAGVFGETQEAKTAKELEELRKKARLEENAQLEGFKKAKTSEELQGIYNAYQALQPQQSSPDFLSPFPQNTINPSFPSPLSPEAQGEAIKNVYGQHRILTGGLGSGMPEANLEASTANLKNEIQSLTRPQTLQTGTARANEELGKATLAEQSINDAEFRKNKILSGRFGALHEGAVRLPEGSVNISAGGTTLYSSPTEALIPNPIINPKTKEIIGYQEPTKIKRPGELQQIGVGQIPLDTTLYGPTGQRNIPLTTVQPQATEGRTYTIPKKSNSLLDIFRIPESGKVGNQILREKLPQEQTRRISEKGNFDFIADARKFDSAQREKFNSFIELYIKNNNGKEPSLEEARALADVVMKGY